MRALTGEPEGRRSESEGPKTESDAWAPLRQRLFRLFWLANLASLIGTWVHQVGAAWLMAELSTSPLLIALVQAAASLPVAFLALPAGALADVLDRRALLLGAQLWMLAVVATLGGLTLAGATGPVTLLVATVLLGVGAALNAPVWQAVLPELVDERELPAAVALGSVGFNVARAIGPALGGLLVAAGGAGVAFLVNAGSFLGVLGVVYLWKRERPSGGLPAEDVASAVVGGLRYVRHHGELRAVLVRVAAFMVCGSALWSLLPVIAKQELGMDALRYGLLLGSLGVGAVSGAFFLARVREALSMDALVAGATLLLAGVIAAVGQLRSLPGLCAVLLVGGLAWLALLSSFNTAVQVLVPSWVRGRAVAVYLLVFALGSTLGSAGWGWLAGRTSTGAALLGSAVAMAGTLVLIPLFRLPRGRPEGLGPSLHWPAPLLAGEPADEAGPVLIEVEYRIDPATAAEFSAALAELARARRRTGAYAWRVGRDLEDPSRRVEHFLVASWTAHLRQHERVSEADRALQERVRALHLSSQAPRVRHLLVEGS